MEWFLVSQPYHETSMYTRSKVAYLVLRHYSVHNKRHQCHKVAYSVLRHYSVHSKWHQRHKIAYSVLRHYSVHSKRHQRHKAAYFVLRHHSVHIKWNVTKVAYLVLNCDAPTRCLDDASRSWSGHGGGGAMDTCTTLCRELLHGSDTTSSATCARGHLHLFGGTTRKIKSIRTKLFYKLE